MRLILGPALIATSGYASRQTSENYFRARALCRKRDPARVSFPIAWGFWVVHYVQAKLERSVDRPRAPSTTGRGGGSLALELPDRSEPSDRLFLVLLRSPHPVVTPPARSDQALQPKARRRALEEIRSEDPSCCVLGLPPCV